MRAPFLQIGGDQQFQMLMDANMTYDSSVSIFDNSPPYWPYTLDFGIQHDCMISPCPTRSYPGLWEIGLIMWHDLIGGGRCTMGNSCTPPSDEQGVFELIMNNFKRHYDTNRAPFGLFYQSNWFTTPHHKAGFLRFIDEVLKLGDVYFVTNWQLLRWIQKPVKLDRIDQFEAWQCPKEHRKQSECLVPNICHVKFQNGDKVSSRFFKTCQRCPNDYPWIDNVEELLSSR
ncbi:hypothetical protein SSS_01556 [Sarcoptes scabiei]|nr:hypothetical protein SSS_01556 [Sarcoptes scabiei]